MLFTPIRLKAENNKDPIRLGTWGFSTRRYDKMSIELMFILITWKP